MLIKIAGKYFGETHESLPDAHLFLLLKHARGLCDEHREEIVNELFRRMQNRLHSKLPPYPTLEDRVKAVIEWFSKPPLRNWNADISVIRQDWNIFQGLLDEYLDATNFMIQWDRQTPATVKKE